MSLITSSVLHPTSRYRLWRLYWALPAERQWMPPGQGISDQSVAAQRLPSKSSSSETKRSIRIHYGIQQWHLIGDKGDGCLTDEEQQVFVRFALRVLKPNCAGEVVPYDEFSSEISKIAPCGLKAIIVSIRKKCRAAAGLKDAVDPVPNMRQTGYSLNTEVIKWELSPEAGNELRESFGCSVHDQQAFGGELEKVPARGSKLPPTRKGKQPNAEEDDNA